MGLHCTAQRCLVVPRMLTSVSVMSMVVVAPSSVTETCREKRRSGSKGLLLVAQLMPSVGGTAALAAHARGRVN